MCELHVRPLGVAGRKTSWYGFKNEKHLKINFPLNSFYKIFLAIETGHYANGFWAANRIYRAVEM